MSTSPGAWNSLGGDDVAAVMTPSSGAAGRAPSLVPHPAPLRASGTPADDRLGPDELGTALGERVTLVQFSSTFCAPCRATRRVLERVVATSDGVVHVELDVADHPALGERLGIDVTPTVLVLDPDGTVRRRASGAPTLAQARAAVASVHQG
ncbi:TlpA family protein disulfide reductase [Cellulomonas soli]|uniref:Thioredoxin domain-containing protein n=1 Tax=Cellulomonas soli TaxID=931535 RepID=A0A512PBK4_9CELL|nr:thioredoxin family protein [Cellulomonas soli]NYI60991.1 thiol-disulfide isomerase/thioredoxin [Cellulomonas soli]GEP68594.1 hypothetical protein CSO01_13090 [Cellulomonas soli]